jgi:hypothetical protein
LSAKVIPNKIHLVGFRIIHAEMKSPFEFDIHQIGSFENDVKFDMFFNLEDAMVKADFNVTIKTLSKENTNCDEATAEFSFVYIFHVENFSDLAKVMADNSLDIHVGLSTALASIVYSTSRGVLMTRFQGTALADFILPIIDPQKLISK